MIIFDLIRMKFLSLLFRELREECGLEAKALRQIGVLTCDIDTIPSILEIHVFNADEYCGDPIESEGKQS